MPPRGHHDKTGRQRAIEQFIAALAKQTGTRVPRVQMQFSDRQVPDEHYVPGAWADPQNRIVTFNTNTHPAGGAQFDDIAASKRTAVRHNVDRQYAAHELGHIAQPDRLDTVKKRDEYMALTSQRRRDLVDPGVLARAGAPIPKPYQLDPFGLPITSSGTTHDSPVERYANDFASSMGYGTLDRIRALALRRAQERGLLPRGPGPTIYDGIVSRR